jgi:hypothetical protein
MTDTMTAEEYRKSLKSGRSKYGNRRVVADGYTFDSKAEHAEYQRLRLRERAGDISKLVVHPKYTVLESFHTSDGGSVPGIVYEADFSYIERGREIVVDVKGRQTDVFKIKKKLLLKAYPNIRFVIVQV